MFSPFDGIHRLPGDAKAFSQFGLAPALRDTQLFDPVVFH